MTMDQAGKLIDYILGMPDREAAGAYLDFTAARLDQRYFQCLEQRLQQATARGDAAERARLEWLRSRSQTARERARDLFDAARDPRPLSTLPTSSVERLERTIQIDQRLRDVMMRRRFNPVDQQIVLDLQGIVDDYRGLSASSAPALTPAAAASEHENFAAALEMLADAQQELDAPDAARHSYAEAAEAHARLGRNDSARACLARADAATGIQAETERERNIHRRLAASQAGSLAHVECLVELGELQVQNGDEFSARDTLEQAKTKLDQLNRREALAPLAVLNILAGAAQDPERELNAAELTDAMSRHQLLKRIALRLFLIYQRQGDLERAEKYRRLGERLER